MNQVKIAHVSTVHPRYDTRIYFREIGGLATSFGIDFYVYDGLGEERHEAACIQIRDIGTPPKSRFWRFISGSIRIYKAIRRSSYKIVHFHDPELMIVMYVLSFYGIAIVFDVHENVSEDIKTKEWLPKYIRIFLSIIYRGIERLLVSRFSVVLAESHYANLYGSEAVIVRNFPDIEMITKYSRQRTNGVQREVVKLCYIGAIGESRGVLRYCQAVQQLRDEGFQLELCLIGAVPELVDKNIDFKKGVNNGSIIKHGRVRSDLAMSIVASCDIGLAVLDREKNFINSYPTKIFEYMALGMPVIASKFPLYEEVVVDNACGFVVEPESLEELKDAIRSYCIDRELIVKHGRSGYEAVRKHYSWKTELSKLYKLYEGIL